MSFVRLLCIAKSAFAGDVLGVDGQALSLQQDKGNAKLLAENSKGCTASVFASG